MRRLPPVLVLARWDGIADLLIMAGRLGWVAVALAAAGVLVRRLGDASFTQRRRLDVIMAPGIAVLAALPLPLLLAGGPGTAADWGRSPGRRE